MTGGAIAALRHVWRLAVHDVSLWRRSPWAIAAAIVPPLAMALLLWVLTLSVGRQPVALVVESHGQYAAKMEGILRSESSYVLLDADRAGANSLLKRQEVAATIVIPRNFDDAVTRCPTLKRSETLHDENYGATGCPAANVQVTLNNVDHDFADDIRRSVAGSTAYFDAADIVTPVSEGQLDLSELNPYRVNVQTSELRTTTVDYLHYAVIPCLVLLILSVGVMGTALLCARDAERGTSRHLVLSPVPSVGLIAGRLLGGVLVSLAVVVPTVIVGTLMGIVAPPAGHWPALALVFVATAVCAAGLGAVLGATVRSARAVAMAASAIVTYLFFLGGGFTTIQFLPDWLRRITTVVPTRYAIDGLRQSLFYPDLHGFWSDMWVLLGTAAVAVLVGGLVVRRTWSR